MKVFKQRLITVRAVGPQRGKALAQEILFKVQVAGLELGITLS